MGQQKLFLDFRGKPVLQWVLEAAMASALDEIVCVVRDLEEAKKKVSLEHPKLRWVINEKAHEGQGTSIIAGLKAIDARSEAALFLVGDQPMIQSEVINGLIELFRKNSKLIVVPTFHGQARNPVLFHRDLFPEILQLTGDRGARALIEKYREKSAFLEWPEESPFLDLDTWDDYERLKGRSER
ncbi:MAG: nucleotidyltransferase family protein [Deltaproteobacteria bacterium]|nr:nucleotidyltransferase family protein [Deltaproteobacteria bacterium]